MIPVGQNQKPLLEYIVRLMHFHGLDDITLLVNYKTMQIKSYFNDGSRFNVKIKYRHDSESLKGTGGSVLHALKQESLTDDDTILVYYGDILSNFDLKALIDFHIQKKGAATVALASGFEVRVGLADLKEDNTIRGFIEKPQLEKPVSIGILAFRGDALKAAQALAEKTDTIDLMGDVLPYLIHTDKTVYGYISKAFWYDVGSIEAYEKLDKNKVEETMSFLF
jgi:mannose-1-phosphate guanylyltransferase